MTAREMPVTSGDVRTISVPTLFGARTGALPDLRRTSWPLPACTATILEAAHRRHVTAPDRFGTAARSQASQIHASRSRGSWSTLAISRYFRSIQYERKRPSASNAPELSKLVRGCGFWVVTTAWRLPFWGRIEGSAPGLVWTATSLLRHGSPTARQRANELAWAAGHNVKNRNDACARIAGCGFGGREGLGHSRRERPRRRYTAGDRGPAPCGRHVSNFRSALALGGPILEVTPLSRTDMGFRHQH